MEHQYRRAEDYYVRALAALPRADRKAQRAGLALGAIQRALLREMRRDGFQVLDRRHALTPLRKLWLAARMHLGGAWRERRPRRRAQVTIRDTIKPYTLRPRLQSCISPFPRSHKTAWPAA